MEAKEILNRFKNGEITLSAAAELAGAAEAAAEEAAVEVDAEPPQAARLSAIAPARKADTRRFIYKFLL